MSLFDKPKRWVVRDGKIGTVHLNRDGKEVDFRAGVFPTREIELCSTTTSTSVQVLPGPGVTAAPLRLQCWEVEPFRIVTPTRILKEWETIYEGESFVFTTSERVVKPRPTLNEERERLRRKRFAQECYQEKVKDTDAFLERAKLTCRDWGRLRRKPWRAFVALKDLHERILLSFAQEMPPTWQPVLGAPTIHLEHGTNVEKLLTTLKDRRERQKAAWLGKKG